MGKVMRHTLGASLNIRHNLSSSKGPKPLQLKLLTTYIPKTSAFTLAFSTSQRLDRKSGSAGMPRPISYAAFCLKKKIPIIDSHQPDRGPSAEGRASERTDSDGHTRTVWRADVSQLRDAVR